VIKKSIEVDSKKISDKITGRKARIDKKDLQEPDFNFDRTTGRHKKVLPGNKEFEVGDRIRRNSSKEKAQRASDSGDGTDEFSFVLTKEEFIELYFEDMALPDFIKQSLKDTNKFKLARAGYSKDGIPPRLDILKTFKQAIARRIATESTRFLDEIDLRYKHFIKKPFPILHAHIFFLMDVSGSMGDYEKGLAKKFFLLLYLFLNKEYEKIEITFIRHTMDAKECSEEEFFYSRETGGTMVSSALKLTNEIIDSRVNLNETNVYIAQASDGDNWAADNTDCLRELQTLVDKVQYFAYIQTETEDRLNWKMDNDVDDLFDVYEMIQDEKLQMAIILKPSDVFPVLQNLFKKE
jgi:uncharacterized sporulation protein YeaH/YhbH (DUF444 family)